MFTVNLKALRKALKLTQTEFGEKLGVTRSVVKNWEYGAVEPTEMAIRHICNTFQVNEEWLRTGKGVMFVESPQEYVEKLIAERHMGPGGQMLMRALLHFYEEMGEEATIKVISEILPAAPDAVAEYESAQFSPKIRPEASEESSQGSVG